MSTFVADVDLAVICREQQHSAGGKHLEEIADQPIDPHELGLVVRAQAVLVGDLVDAVVVRVDERLTFGEQLDAPR